MFVFPLSLEAYEDKADGHIIQRLHPAGCCFLIHLKEISL